MAKLTTSSVAASVTEREAHARAAPVSNAHVLITEHEVLLGTAAAMPLPRRRLIDVVSRLVSSARVRWQTRAERNPIRRAYPSRLYFLEHSLMSREMDRL